MIRSPRVLVAARMLAGLSQEDLAQAAGIAVSVLSAIEQGKSDPRNSTLIALVDALAERGVQIVNSGGGVVGGAVLLEPPKLEAPVPARLAELRRKRPSKPE